MSISTQYGNRAPGEPPLEDCRDYLRTGRCKYGSSCKYNHPQNVQSGGGMTSPLDPSEPMFPIRPSEPVCQYYMKHGTCKFGQACKFHHPPQLVVPGLVNTGAVLVNVAPVPSRKAEVPIFLNHVTQDANGVPMVLQFLPQRPEEPDCIYYLKNGRCKYGATCRYHHPTPTYQQPTRMDSSRRQLSSSDLSKFQYIVPQGSFPNGHVLVSEGPMTVRGSDGPNQNFQVFSSSDNSSASFSAAPHSGFIAVDHGSSSPSLASSYETRNTALWRRAKEQGSTGSLPTYGDRVVAQPAPRSVPQVTSDGNLSIHRLRTASYGSAMDAAISSYSTYEVPPPEMSRSVSAGYWRNDGAASSERTTSDFSGGPFRSNDDARGAEGFDSRSPATRSRLPPSSAANMRLRSRLSRANDDDDDFTMLPSALLNVLDTHDELSESFLKGPPGYAIPTGPLNPEFLERLSLTTPNFAAPFGRVGPSNSNRDGKGSAWSSPTWPGSSNGSLNEQAGEAASMLLNRQSQHSNSPTEEVGLYLP